MHFPEKSTTLEESDLRQRHTRPLPLPLFPEGHNHPPERRGEIFSVAV